MRLFDEINRSDAGPAPYAEREFSYLNRSARPEVGRIRDVLDTWFARYPDPDRTDLHARFRSKSNHQHRSAFFELVLHELLLRLGCRPTVHPSVPTGTTHRPDFLAQPALRDPFYLEATLATDESTAEVAAEARKATVYDALDRLDSPNFFIGMGLRGAPTTPPRAAFMRSFLTERLTGLDPDRLGELMRAGGSEALPRWLFEHEGWRIEFFPIPKSPDGRGKPGIRPIGVQMSAPRYVSPRDAVRDAIIDKGKRYGNLELSYIVAINALDRAVDDSDIMEALFGKEQVVVTLGPSGPRETIRSRAHDGAWVGPSGPQYTRISGVLVAIRLEPWTLAHARLRLYHHPGAQRPCPDALARLPHAIPDQDRMSFQDGTVLGELLGLAPNWPMSEA